MGNLTSNNLGQKKKKRKKEDQWQAGVLGIEQATLTLLFLGQKIKKGKLYFSLGLSYSFCRGLRDNYTYSLNVFRTTKS